MDEPKETPVYKHSMPVQIRFNDVDVPNRRKLAALAHDIFG